MRTPRTRQSREQRAAAFFALYAQQGSTRSLESLHVTGIGLGLRIGLSTLRKYSVDYRWAQRVRELDEDAAASRSQPVAQVLLMNERQADLGKSAQLLAARAFDALAKQTVPNLTPAEAIRLAKEGQHIERLAMGEATSREDITVSVYAELVQAIATLFVSVNDLPDPEARMRRFALGVDGLVDAHAQGMPIEARHVDQISAEESPTPQPAT